MGASNVALAFQLYAGKVPPTSMQVLLYMANVSIDADPKPWFSQGRKTIAEIALGRAMPFDRADARAVERAIEPLLAIGAITTERKASVRRDGDSTARYRLNLSIIDAPRKTSGEKKAHAPRKTSAVKGSGKDSRPTKSAPHAPRNSSSRPTDSVLTPHEFRGPEEKEDLSRSEIEEEVVDLQTASRPPRVAAPSEPAPVIALFPDSANAPNEPAYRALSPWGTRRDAAADAITAATARRAKAVADHQTRLAAESKEIS